MSPSVTATQCASPLAASSLQANPSSSSESELSEVEDGGNETNANRNITHVLYLYTCQ